MPAAEFYSLSLPVLLLRYQPQLPFEEAEGEAFCSKAFLLLLILIEFILWSLPGCLGLWQKEHPVNRHSVSRNLTIVSWWNLTQASSAFVWLCLTSDNYLELRSAVLPFTSLLWSCFTFVNSGRHGVVKWFSCESHREWSGRTKMNKLCLFSRFSSSLTCHLSWWQSLFLLASVLQMETVASSGKAADS